LTRGRVILVGAGPGAPDLITVRGAAALGEADAVVYDSLASKELLELAPRAALRIDVGKRGHDAPTVPQEDTTSLLLRLAAEGKTVVRLKGGDPYVFGRGGEEASACAQAGVPFEVVPGVSSIFGALAYAGIPVTDRRHAASFAVVTGHKDPTKVSAETRWELLGEAADTLLILMGMRNLAEIVARLIAGGRSASTPAAVVMNGTLPSQRVVEAPLGELPARAALAGIGAPAIVVVGDVVRLREQLAWYERQPLFGRRVLVTRSAEQAPELARALSSAGAEPVVIPLIELRAAPDPTALDMALARLDQYDALIFTSANAVRFTAERADARGIAPSRARAVVCVGSRTAEAAVAAGFSVDYTPAHRYDARGVLEEITRVLPPRGRRFLLPRSELADERLPRGLGDAGAAVDAPVAYRNVAAEVDVEALRAALVAGQLDVLSFASPSAVRRFRELLDDASLARAAHCLVAAIGPTTAQALHEAGLPAQVIASRSGVAGLVEAIAASVAAQTESR
jgi:uroporphyrinogen III methyltransferase/synthase